MLAMVLAAPAPALAQETTITVGLYAPTAPFDGPTQKLEFITSVAGHLSAYASGKRVIGRVYSSARSFLAAAKRGDIQFAVVDGPFAAANGLPYRILASATRSGRSTSPWQLVATSSIRGLGDLKGKSIAAPEVGARAAVFITNVLLNSEIDESFFRKMEWAPNPNSAATMVSLGRVDAAFVPAGTTLPTGIRTVLTLDSVGWPMLVSLSSADRSMVSRFETGIMSYSGSGVFDRFASADGGNYRSLRSSFSETRRKGLMSVPRPARLAVRDLLGGRSFALQPSDMARLVLKPELPASEDSKPAGGK